MLKGFLNLFLKSNCPLCERPSNQELCSYCEQQLQTCQFSTPHQFWQGELPLFVWGQYDGLLKRAIAALKYEGKSELGELLGYWLGESWLDSPLGKEPQKLTVVPIPLHPDKLKTRGFNQAELIARGFCQVTGYALKKQGLQRVKQTEALFGLSPTERATEVKEAFALGKNFQHRLPSTPVLLLDDIYTTGATVREVQQILMQNKIPVKGVVALATSQKNS